MIEVSMPETGNLDSQVVQVPRKLVAITIVDNETSLEINDPELAMILGGVPHLTDVGVAGEALLHQTLRKHELVSSVAKRITSLHNALTVKDAQFLQRVANDPLNNQSLRQLRDYQNKRLMLNKQEFGNSIHIISCVVNSIRSSVMSPNCDYVPYYILHDIRNAVRHMLKMEYKELFDKSKKLFECSRLEVLNSSPDVLTSINYVRSQRV